MRTDPRTWERDVIDINTLLDYWAVLLLLLVPFLPAVTAGPKGGRRG